MSVELTTSPDLRLVEEKSSELAQKFRHEFITPEHLLLEICSLPSFKQAMALNGGYMELVGNPLLKYLSGLEQVPGNHEYDLDYSHLYSTLHENTVFQVVEAGQTMIGVHHILNALFDLKESYASQVLWNATNCEDEKDKAAFISDIYDFYHSAYNDNDDDANDDDDYQDSPIVDMQKYLSESSWESFVTPISKKAKSRSPLIGREMELERTIQVLCRREKNNPLHIGEPGVGKSALIYGLAQRINSGNVPNRLKGYEIYQIDMSDLMAGTQYRGDLEKRIKMIMNGLQKNGKAIVYIDEIHNMVGTGSCNNSTLDASNMLKPYIEDSSLRFIGATTFEDYKRTLANSRGIMRHFQQIDILEPSIEESIRIISRIKADYEDFHGVTYPDDVITYAVKSSAKYINNRALPDKAIDLIDEAGAQLEICQNNNKTVTKELVSQVLAKICKVDHLADLSDSDEQLDTLYQRISDKIYGQDEAVKKVVEAILMSRAGLLDDNKPTASMLFVGPTGVGKTEVAKVLAKEMGMNLVRFDMSEYAEKHAVAKLIGSPAGYVGYDDGGLLTDAIRKTPNCVLLLDEIEKAHSDIYNILLQVMDYASLTDNKGHKADFRHVVLIMTSNAGAQHASKANVGFNSTSQRGEAMMKSVKATFKPEFLNRLSSTVVFNDLDINMASLILDKKLRELHSKLQNRKVKLTISDGARNWLIKKGFTPEYGAREIERVINSALNPPLMKEILFGKLTQGGYAYAECTDDDIVITSTKRPKRNTNK